MKADNKAKLMFSVRVTALSASAEKLAKDPLSYSRQVQGAEDAGLHAKIIPPKVLEATSSLILAHERSLDLETALLIYAPGLSSTSQKLLRAVEANAAAKKSNHVTTQPRSRLSVRVIGGVSGSEV